MAESSETSKFATKSLSLHEWQVLTRLLEKKEGFGVTDDDLRVATGLSEDALNSALRLLTNLGVISTKRTQEGTAGPWTFRTFFVSGKIGKLEATIDAGSDQRYVMSYVKST